MAQSSVQKKAAAKSRAKQRERIADRPPSQGNPLQSQMGQLQMSLLNMRQMYDQKVMETQALKNLATSRDQIIAALVAGARNKRLVIKKSALEAVLGGKYAGVSIDPVEDSDDLVVTLVLESDLEDDAEG